jgi:Uma2 family endonuclease
MGSAPKRKLPIDMTTDQFFDWPGDGSGRKFQLVDGEPRAMAPPSATHGIIQANLASLIKTQLRATGLPCVVATEPPVVPRLAADKNLRSPDLGVSCCANADARRDLAEPLLLIEILSPSNKSETWLNVWAFATLPSVREILVIDSTKREAKQLQRGADGALPEVPVTIASTQTLHLASLSLDVTMDDVYEGTRLSEA